MNKLEQKLEQQKLEVQQLEQKLEQQKSLEAQWIQLEQSNDDAYQAQLAIKAQIESLGASIDTFAQQGVNRAETLIELACKRTEIDKVMEKTQKERLEMVIVVYHQILDQHRLKHKLDCNFKLNHFNVCLELVSKYPALFNGTPVMLQNFIANKQHVALELMDKWKNKINQ